MELLNEINVTLNFDNGESVLLDSSLFEKKAADEAMISSYRLIANCHDIKVVNEFWLSITADRDMITVSYNVELETTPLRGGYGLAREKGIVITLLHSIQTDSVLAHHQHKSWWTRPVFATDISGIPSKTASLCLKLKNGKYMYFLPLSGKLSKTEISGCADGSLCFEVNNLAEGISAANDICFSYGSGSDIYSLVHDVFEAAAKCHPNKPYLKSQKTYPQIFDYFGWCSWDAFYTQVNESGLLNKTDEFIEKGIPVKWMLIDDGWLDVKDEALCSFSEDSEKFPAGFSYLTNELHKKGIEHVGVWHALGGYWGGVSADSKVSRDMGTYLYRNRKNKLLPHYKCDKGFYFWNKWYEYLHANGIDFVKVDGQSAIANYYRSEIPIGIAARGMHGALNAAVCSWFGDAVINCMGMSSENMWSRISSPISRNSDDFVPSEELGFAEHALQNAYNSIYHGQMYYCDWDMFWTNHPDAVRHSVLRGVSGGPIYISDKVNETDLSLIKPLIYSDGRIIRCDGDGIPAESCLWSDPRKSDVLKIINHYGSCRIMAIFNLLSVETVAEVRLEDINADTPCIVYDYFTQNAVIFEDSDQVLNMELDSQGVGLVNFIPFEKEFTAIGLVGKYAVAHGVVRSTQYDKFIHVTLAESGTFAFYSAQEPIKIMRGNEDVTRLIEKKDNIYFLRLDEGGAETNLLVQIR